jgi:filamentous hemagglutinin
MNVKITVMGLAVCPHCIGHIPAMAKKTNLNSIIIHKQASGKSLYWKPGMRSLKKVE